MFKINITPEGSVWNHARTPWTVNC